eukprot:g24715.t1
MTQTKTPTLKQGLSSNVAREKRGKSDANPGTFFTDDEWLVIQNLADEVGERHWQVKDTETSALVEEDEHQGVDGGEAGVVRLVQGEDELLKGGHEAVGLGVEIGLRTRGMLLPLWLLGWKASGIGMGCQLRGMGQPLQPPTLFLSLVTGKEPGRVIFVQGLFL